MTFIDPATVPQRTLYTGARMPAVGMGTFGSDHADPEEVSASVAGAIRVGYRSFDCAACYGNEDQIGKVFAQAFEEGVVKREELFIASKVWNDMHGKGDVLLACAKSLRDLGLDYLDMYYVHWPFPNYHAPHCDVDSRNPDSKPFSVFHGNLETDGTSGRYGTDETYRYVQYDDPETGSSITALQDQTCGYRDGTSSMLPAAGTL